jgi:hypothetical protein
LSKLELILVILVAVLVLLLITDDGFSISARADERPALSDQWNFITGTEQRVDDYSAQHPCVTAIWQYSNVGGWTFWRVYFPGKLQDDYFPIQYLFEDESYLVWCAGGE